MGKYLYDAVMLELKRRAQEKEKKAQVGTVPEQDANGANSEPRFA